jgi:hypothetical protein
MTSDKRLKVTLSDEERKLLTAWAQQLGMSESGYMRLKTFAPLTDTSIHLTDRMQATSQVGLGLNSARRLATTVQQLIDNGGLFATDPIVVELQIELAGLQLNLTLAFDYLFQPNPYVG